MASFWGLHAKRVAASLCMPGVAAGAALMLAACNTESQPNIAAVQTRGASVAFASIDGLPQGQFQTLVQDLNTEARTRRLAVASREQPSAYRVRGYLAATVDRGKTTISWVWDVFDRNQRRALRISGSETAKAGDGWQAADNTMLQRIAHGSMGQLAAFLTSPAVAPEAPPAASGPQIAFATPDITTPEIGRNLPHFPPQGRSDFDARARRHSCPNGGCRRADAAPPPGAGDRAFARRNHDPGGRPPLTAA